MKNGMSVSSFDSVNSAIMFNMEIMIIISITVTKIITAIMIIDFKFFQMSL